MRKIGETGSKTVILNKTECHVYYDKGKYLAVLPSSSDVKTEVRFSYKSPRELGRFLSSRACGITIRFSLAKKTLTKRDLAQILDEFSAVCGKRAVRNISIDNYFIQVFS